MVQYRAGKPARPPPGHVMSYTRVADAHELSPLFEGFYELLPLTKAQQFYVAQSPDGTCRSVENIYHENDL